MGKEFLLLPAYSLLFGYVTSGKKKYFPIWLWLTIWLHCFRQHKTYFSIFLWLAIWLHNFRWKKNFFTYSLLFGYISLLFGYVTLGKKKSFPVCLWRATRFYRFMQGKNFFSHMAMPCFSVTWLQRDKNFF